MSMRMLTTLSVLVAFIVLLSLSPSSSPLLDVSGRSIKASERIHSSLKQLQPMLEVEHEHEQHEKQHHHPLVDEHGVESEDNEDGVDHVHLQSGMSMVPSGGGSPSRGRPSGAAAAPAAGVGVGGDAGEFEEKQAVGASSASVGSLAEHYRYPAIVGTPAHGSFIPVISGRYNCDAIARALYETFDAASRPNLERMFGVALVDRAATAAAPAGLQLVWAISGQDNPAEHINYPELHVINHRLHPLIGIEVSSIDRATYRNTRGIRNAYIRVLDERLGNEPQFVVNGQTYRYGVHGKVRWFEGRFAQGAGWGNTLGECAGAKLTAYLSPSTGFVAGSHPRHPLGEHDRILCMAEVNHINKESVNVRDASGTLQPYGRGALTPSCSSCQIQMVDFLYNPPIPSAPEDEHKESAHSAAVASSSLSSSHVAQKRTTNGAHAVSSKKPRTLLTLSASSSSSDVVARPLKANGRIHSSLKQLQPTLEVEHEQHERQHHPLVDEHNVESEDEDESDVDHVHLQHYVSVAQLQPAGAGHGVGGAAAGAAPVRADAATYQYPSVVGSTSGVGPLVPVISGEYNCEDIARILYQAFDDAARLRLQKMFGVALVQRAATATVSAGLELIWAISGQDHGAAGAITSPALGPVNARLNPHAIGTINRATFDNTEGKREAYIAQINAHPAGPAERDVDGERYRVGTSHHGGQFFERHLDHGHVEWCSANAIGVCAGGKIAAFISPTTADETPQQIHLRHPLGAAPGEELICMAEINHLPNPQGVRVHNIDGTRQQYLNDDLTPSCPTCQVQMRDFLDGATIRRAPADMDEHKTAL